MSIIPNEITDKTTEIIVNSTGLILASFFVILLPLILSFLWIRYYHGKIFVITIGIAGLTFSIIAEGIIVAFLILLTGQKNFIFYLIMGLSPGIFEETGRYICYKYFLKNYLNSKKTPISYGIGHWGIESIFLGIQFISYIFLKNILIKDGTLTENITFVYCLSCMIERISMVTLHISLSIFVFKAIKDNKLTFFFIEIILHDFVDIFTLLRFEKIITNLFVYEIIILLVCVSIAVFAYKIYYDFMDINGEYSEFTKIRSDIDKEVDGRTGILAP